MEFIGDEFVCEYSTPSNTDRKKEGEGGKGTEDEGTEDDCTVDNVQDLEIVQWDTIEEVENDSVIKLRLQNEDVSTNLEHCKSLSKKIGKKFQKETMKKKKSHLFILDDLYNFNITYTKSMIIDGTSDIKYSNSSYIQMLMEKVLCVSASEAVCERLFRHSSLFAKRQYVTKLNNKTVHDITFIKHYLKVMWELFVREMRIEDVLG